MPAQARPVSTEELRARIAQALPNLRLRYPIDTIGVFGSWARGEQSPESDVDLLVRFDKPVGFFAFLELKEELEILLRVRVDLVTPGGLRPQLEERIARELLAT
jgi:uncharacterized protein